MSTRQTTIPIVIRARVRPHAPAVPRSSATLILCLFGASLRAGEPSEVILQAVDIDTGLAVPGVTFARENSAEELWAMPIGTSGADGILRTSVDGTGAWYYCVWQAPDGCSVAGIDEVRLDAASGGCIMHTFKLRRRSPGDARDAPPLSPEDRSRIPPPRRLAGRACLVSTVPMMPGFEGKEVQFQFYPDEQGRVANAQLDLAAEVFRSGELVALAVSDELRYFRKAEPHDKGRLDGMHRIVIQIDQLPPDRPRTWRFECHLPEELFRRGYRITFRELEWWDLNVPDYWQDDYEQ